MGIDCSKRGTAVKFHEKWGQAVKLTNRKGEKVLVPVLTDAAMVNPRCEVTKYLGAAILPANSWQRPG